MTIQISPSLRRALVLDAAVSGVAAFAMLAGANVLAPLLGLPSALMFWAGAACVPFVALLVVVARRRSVHRLVLLDIVALNALWVIGSLYLLGSGLVAPTALGTAFVLVQTAAVGLFLVLQLAAFRSGSTAAHQA